MFDFNCNITNDKDYEMLPYVSSANIVAGLYEGKPINLMKFAKYLTEHEMSVGVLVDINSKDKDKEKIFAEILYQISAAGGFLDTYDIKVENIRLNKEGYDKLNSDKEFAKLVSDVVKQYNPWLNIIVNNKEIKDYLEGELNSKCALEIEFSDNLSIREIRENENKIETIHFNDIENLKRAYDVLKPTPITYNRVSEDF